MAGNVLCGILFLLLLGWCQSDLLSNVDQYILNVGLEAESYPYQTSIWLEEWKDKLCHTDARLRAKPKLSQGIFTCLKVFGVKVTWTPQLTTKQEKRWMLMAPLKILVLYFSLEEVMVASSEIDGTLGHKLSVMYDWYKYIGSNAFIALILFIPLH